MSARPAYLAEFPAELLYWGFLPAGAGDAQAARYRVERFLPVDIDQLHGTWRRLPGGERIFIGIEPERLRAHLATRDDISPRTWGLVPDRIPDHLPAACAAARTTLDLLHGAFEPAPRRRLRRVLAATCLAAVLLVALLTLVGIERQRQRRLDLAAALDAATRRRIELAVPGDGGQPAAQRLLLELRRLEASAALSTQASDDAARTLEALLAALPADLRIQVESLIVAPDRIIIRARTADLVAAEKLHRALARVPGVPYRSEPLQAQQAEGFALANISLVAGGAP